jgi:large subunit ribosomal protein L17
MRHKKSKYQLNRFTSWRSATLTSLARSIILHQSIKTTKIKAKAIRSLADKLISLAKKNTLSARRAAFQILKDHSLVSLLFKEIGPRFANRTGGYTRILTLGKRRGDNAEIVILELTEIKKKEKPKSKKESKTHEKKSEKIEKDTRHDIEYTQSPQEETPKTDDAVQEKPPATQKPTKKFLGGLRNIFKKERDSL